MTERRRLFDFASPAFTFVFTLGVVNLFADVTYEGGSSINGPFLAALALALAGSWPAAAAMMLAERVGRGIRKPTVEAMLSHTTGTLGRGWVYALNTALDETGATVGPLLVAFVLWRRGAHRVAFAWLAVPAALALVSLVVARSRFPLPARLAEGPTATVSGFGRPFRLFAAGAALFAAGLLSFELISFHLAATGALSPGRGSRA